MKKCPYIFNDGRVCNANCRNKFCWLHQTIKCKCGMTFLKKNKWNHYNCFQDHTIWRMNKFLRKNSDEDTTDDLIDEKWFENK